MIQDEESVQDMKNRTLAEVLHNSQTFDIEKTDPSEKDQLKTKSQQDSKLCIYEAAFG